MPTNIDRDGRPGRAVDEIGGNARLLVLDVTDAHSIADAARQVDKLDILINNRPRIVNISSGTGSLGWSPVPW